MRHKIVLIVALLVSVAAQAEIQFRGGPYLQEVTGKEATIVFEHPYPTLSWVELRKKGALTVKKYYQVIDGGRQAYSELRAASTALPVQNFTIRMTGLSTGTNYEYRICQQKMTKWEPYSVTYEDVEKTDWYSFQTLNPNATEQHIIIVSDMHNRPDTLHAMLHALDYATADHIIYAGDIMDNMQGGVSTSSKGKEEPYASLINVSTELFATGKAFDIVRGECDT